MKNILAKFGLPALTILTFFIVLGNRPLNEPDEGRYSEVAQEMMETGDWIVPHFWYLPHLDKPPLVYWLEAASMEVFGQNEWAVRLPTALAGISGVWAAFLLGRGLGGKRAGVYAALILQSAVFYWGMARMLTTDIFLTQFTAWVIYFFWRSWTALKDQNDGAKFFAWHLLAWVFIALGFLTKGPVALAIPVVSFLALIFFRRKEMPKMAYAGLAAGFLLFLIIAAPWFVVVFQRVPQAAHYMIFGQAAGHLLGTTIKNRTGFPGYYLGVLAVGLLPWTLLLGWLWRRSHWRNLDPKSKDGWVLLNVWVIFTFVLFSISRAKLPPYILPVFPALAVLLAWKFLDGSRTDESAPKIIWRIGLAAAFVLPVIFPLLVFFLMHDKLPWWLVCQAPIALAILILIFKLAQKWKQEKIAAFSVGLALAGFFLTMAEFPLFDFNFKSNQPLDQIGLALRQNFQPGDAVVCWGRLPQSLPFYTVGIISQTNRAYLGDMSLNQVPFEFPGNLERLGSLYLDKDAFSDLLHGSRRVIIVGFGSEVENFQKKHPDISLRLISRSGKWTLYTKDSSDKPENSSRL